MCQNVYGCRVIQRLLMYADEETRAGIIEAVLKDVVANAVDTYSNYVIQHILVNGPEAARYLSLERMTCAHAEEKHTQANVRQGYCAPQPADTRLLSACGEPMIAFQASFAFPKGSRSSFSRC